jgi:GNAT superfamily N-acetyltransferase
MNQQVKIVTVDPTTVTSHGFFCYKSKRKSAGYQHKLNWLKARFSEGMKIKILYENGRSVGFIEYIPGEFAWRAVRAREYAVIHCLWVVGRGKGKGYGSLLLQECIKDAREMGKHGVAMVTSSHTWLAGKKLLLKNGFEPVDQAPPVFELLVQKFDQSASPAFPKDWEARLVRWGPGLTIVRSNQCPYIESSVKVIYKTAGEMGIKARVVELHSPSEVQDRAPSAYGVFNVVYNGELLTYHPIGGKDLLKLLNERKY